MWIVEQQNLEYLTSMKLILVLQENPESQFDCQNDFEIRYRYISGQNIYKQTFCGRVALGTSSQSLKIFGYSFKV